MFLLVRLSGCWFHVESCWVDLLLLGDSLCTNWKYSLLFLIRFWSLFFVSILFLDLWNAAGSIRCCLEIFFYELFCFCCRNDLCLAMRETDCTLSIRFVKWPNTAFDYVGSLHGCVDQNVLRSHSWFLLVASAVKDAALAHFIGSPCLYAYQGWNCLCLYRDLASLIYPVVLSVPLSFIATTGLISVVDAFLILSIQHICLDW